MNVKYNEMSVSDASKILGVHWTSVCRWCRDNIINHQDISDGNGGKPRYLLDENEIYYIKDLMKKYGSVRKAMLYYKKNHEVVENNEEVVEEEKPMAVVATLPIKREADIDDITLDIMQIRELRERLENLEAERNQIIGEIDLLKKKVMDAI